MEQIGVGTVNLNTVCPGVISMFGCGRKSALQRVNLVYCQFVTRRKTCFFQLRCHGAGGHGFIPFVKGTGGLASGVIELNKHSAAILMNTVAENAHGVAVVQALQKGLAGHGDTAKLRADHTHIADDHKATAAFGLGGIVFNAALTDLTGSLTETVVHRGKDNTVSSNAATDSAARKHFFVHADLSFDSLK